MILKINYTLFKNDINHLVDNIHLDINLNVLCKIIPYLKDKTLLNIIKSEKIPYEPKYNDIFNLIINKLYLNVNNCYPLMDNTYFKTLESYKKVLEKSTESQSLSLYAIKSGIINKPTHEDLVEIIKNKYLNKSLEFKFYFMFYNYIVKDSGEYHKIIKSILKDTMYSFMLIVNEVVTRESKYYKLLIDKCKKDDYGLLALDAKGFLV